MKKKLKIKRLCLGLLITLTSCGESTLNPIGDGSSRDQAESLINQDKNVAKALISEQIDDLIATLSDGYGTIDDFSLRPVTNFARESVCEEISASEIKVTVTTSDGFERTPARRLLKFVGSENSTTRAVWSSNAVDLACHRHLKRGDIDFRSVSSLHLNINFDMDRVYEVIKRIDENKLREGAYELSGTRDYEFEGLDSSDGSVSLVQTLITARVERNSKVNTLDGTQVSLISSDEIDEGNPLVVRSVFENATGLWKSRTIGKGKKIAIFSDQSRIESSYENLKMAIENGCQPISGSITGKLFDRSDLDTAFDSFIAEFAANGALVTFTSSGESFRYEADTCDFEG